jgi:hypothetical protein
MGLAILARLFCCAKDICVWLDWRSERELRRWLMRDRRSAGPSTRRRDPASLRTSKSACATCREAFFVFSGLNFAEAGWSAGNYGSFCVRRFFA